ncbi:hypothetical protein V8C35DRAFT_312523, partial [Trichoderma chlorosporum]
MASLNVCMYRRPLFSTAMLSQFPICCAIWPPLVPIPVPYSYMAWMSPEWSRWRDIPLPPHDELQTHLATLTPWSVSTTGRGRRCRTTVQKRAMATGEWGPRDERRRGLLGVLGI